MVHGQLSCSNDHFQQYCSKPSACSNPVSYVRLAARLFRCFGADFCIYQFQAARFRPLVALFLLLAILGLASAGQPGPGEADETKQGIMFDPGWAATEPPPGMVSQQVVFMRVSGRLIRQLARQPVHQDDTIRETVLGFPVRAYARAYAMTDIQLVQRDHSAGLVIPIHGGVKSRGVTSFGFLADVRIYSTRFSRFDTQIPVDVSQHGITLSYDDIQLRSDSVITDISTPIGGILGMAMADYAHQRAEQQKSKFDQALDQLTRRTVRRSIEDRVRQAMSSVDQFIASAVDVFEEVPEDFLLRPQFRTTKDHLYLTLSRHVPQSAAALAGVPMPEDQPPFVAQFHTSLIQRALTESQVIELLRPVVERFLEQHRNTLERIRE